MAISEILLRMLLSAAIGAVLGLDRESRQRPAGLRTYMLVCLGSASTMMTGLYVYANYGAGDPMRIAAQVVCGIGFLGAGTIIVTKQNHVMGLTTAAGLWAAACTGLMTGAGFYSAAIIMGLFIIIILTICGKLDDKIRQHSKMIIIDAKFLSENAAENFINSRKSEGCEFHKIKIIRKNKVTVKATVITNSTTPHSDLIQNWSKAEDLISLEEI